MEATGQDVLSLIGEDSPENKKVQVPESLLSFVKQEFLQLKVKLAQQKREIETFMPQAGKVKVAWALQDIDDDLAHKLSTVQEVSFTEIKEFDQSLQEKVENKHRKQRRIDEPIAQS